MYNTKIRLKKWVRISLLCIIIFLFLSSIYMIMSSIKVSNNDKHIVYSYNISQNLDYKVQLYSNSFIEEEFLGKNESYISDLVKNINADFSYQYFGSKITDLEYEYSIIADIHGEYQLEDSSNIKIWNKEYVLVEPVVKKETENSQFSIKESVDIDYNYYNNVVSEFRKELKLPINVNLIVTFNVDVKGTVDGEKINSSKKMLLTIPLNQQAFKISEKYDKNVNNNISKKTQAQEKTNYRRFISGIITGCMALLMFLASFREIFGINKKTYYVKERDRLLKTYGDIIVEIVNPVENEDMTIIVVKNFNEMVDLEEELRIPIMFYEIEEDELGEFVLVNDNIMYQYLLENTNEKTNS